MRCTIQWNGGRNGWHSAMVGLAWMPSLGALATPAERRAEIRRGGWSMHVYLVLWVLTIRGPRA